MAVTCSQALSVLMELDLSNCTSLRNLPDAIGQLTMLQKVNLEKCMALATLPEALCALTSLRSLNLTGCEIPTRVA